ncbi:MAG: zinc-dependent metalloprotease, partial [Acidobacteriota bacterium]
PVPKAHQMDAVKFLNENAFQTPTWAIDKDILRKIEPVGALNRVRNSQNSVLNNLLSSARFARLAEQSAIDGDVAYQPGDFLADVRSGVWGELSAAKVTIDPYRRNLQRSYLDIANNKLNSAPAALPQGLPQGFTPPPTSGDEKAYYRSELRTLSAAISAALPRTDRASRVHLEYVRDQIAKILDPEKNGAPAAAGAGNRQGLEFLEMMADPTSCFPDYVIRP